MEIQISQTGRRMRLKPMGDIDENGADALNKRFRELNRKDFDELILDFGRVNYIGSSGIGQLILFYKELAPDGGKVSITDISQELHDLLLDLDIHKVIQIQKG